MKKIYFPALLIIFIIGSCQQKNTQQDADEFMEENLIHTVKDESKPGANIYGSVKLGKYGCTAMRYANGSYEYSPKGSFTLHENGSYTYNGFEEASKGTFAVNEKGVISFKDGYFNGGEATPIEDRENRYYLVFPSNPDNRWTCGLE